jgi:hypothetical protein
VTAPARVHRPPPAADRVRPAWLLVAAGAGLAGGIGLIWLTVTPPPTTPEPDETPPVGAAGPGTTPEPQEGEATAPAARPSDGEPAEEAPSPAAAPGSETEDAPAPAAAPAPEAQEAPAPVAPPEDPAPPHRQATSPTLRMVPGRVAYLQCEGVPQQDGPFPCPRDLPLESRVWEALRALPDCPTAPTAPGRADLRWVYASGETPELRFLGSATDLNEGRLRTCLEGPLTALRTELSPELMVVSFRFELVPGR